MKILLTKKEIEQFIYNTPTFTHKWSCSGLGKSTLILGDKKYTETGCGYDRFGAALGDMIQDQFSAHLPSLLPYISEFYGLNLLRDGHLYLDGACGEDCMFKILAAMGLTAKKTFCDGYKKNNGTEVYTLQPLTKAHYYFRTIEEIEIQKKIKMHASDFKLLLTEKGLKIKEVCKIYRLSTSSIYKYNCLGEYPAHLINAIKRR